MAAIEIQGLEKSFGPVQVLRDINLSIGDGEFLAAPIGEGDVLDDVIVSGGHGVRSFGSAPDIAAVPRPRKEDIKKYAYPYAGARNFYGRALGGHQKRNKIK